MHAGIDRAGTGIGIGCAGIGIALALTWALALRYFLRWSTMSTMVLVVFCINHVGATLGTTNTLLY